MMNDDFEKDFSNVGITINDVKETLVLFHSKADKMTKYDFESFQELQAYLRTLS